MQDKLVRLGDDIPHDHRMTLRSFVIFVCFAAVVDACSCAIPSVQSATNDADLVFRGSIIALRDSAEPSPVLAMVGVSDTKAVVVFRVKRVWKGSVGPTFEMPALNEVAAKEGIDCIGFPPSLLKVGNDLLVYAGRLKYY